MKTFTLPAHQCTLRFHDLPGEGTPLLFIHGLGCAASCDFPQVAAHASLAGRRRILPDLPGAGFSDSPESFGYGTTDHADAMIALINSLNLESLDLYGHSMGGAIAIEVADRLAPRIRHLVLSEPNLDSGGGAFSRAVAAIGEADYLASGHHSIIREAQTSGAGIWAASMRNSAAYAVHRAARSLVDGVKPSWRERLVQLRMPRSVIFGEHSLPDPDLDLLKAQGIQTLVLAGVGHSMIWEDPAGLATLIATCLHGEEEVATPKN